MDFLSYPLNLGFLLPVILLTAMANRFSGYDDIPGLPGRNLHYAALGLGLTLAFIGGPIFGLLAGLSLLCYRTLGWFKLLDIGSDKGDPKTEFILMGFRSMLAAVPFLVYHYFFLHQAPNSNDYLYAVAFAVLMGFGCAAGYAIGIWVKPFSKLPDKGWATELMAGAVLGVYYCLEYYAITDYLVKQTTA